MSAEDIQKRIIQALQNKLGPPRPCVMCGHIEWQVADKYIVLSASPNPSQVSIGGQVFPFITLICNNCGNTQFLNLLKLGFTTQDFESLRFTQDDTRQ